MKKLIYSLFFVGSLFTLVACQRIAENPEIIIVHSNDTHSQIDAQVRDGVASGGMIERAAIIEKLRAGNPNLLYLDAGDMVQGSPYFNIYKGKLETYGMDAQALIATTFGNHEFDNGVDSLAACLALADYKLVNCNYHCEGTSLEPYVIPYYIIENQGVRIGITGVTCDPEGLIFARNYAGVSYSDPTATADSIAAILKNEKGCDLVVLLSHYGITFDTDTIGDLNIAHYSHNIDLILGGHTHTNIEEGYVTPNIDGRNVYITQTGGRNNPMGHVSVKMHHNGKHADGTPAYQLDTIVCSKLHPDMQGDLSAYGQKVTDLLAPYQAEMNAQMNEAIGAADADMTRFRPQSPLGNFVADALLVLGERLYGHKMDVAVMNIGGLRNDWAKGDITLGDLYKVFPFENTMVQMELRGSELIELIEAQGRDGRIDAFAGISFTLHKDSKGSTSATNILVGGKPINPKRTYYLSTIDYLADGNGGMTMFNRALKKQDSGVTLRDGMIGYVKELTAAGKPIHAELDNRVIEK